MEKRKKKMLVPTLIMAAIAAAMLLLAIRKGDGSHVEGTKEGMRMLLEIAPMFLLAMLVAGMAQVLIPKDVIAGWIGPESGMRGILIGSFAGALVPSGPVVSFPIVAGLMNAGAGLGTLVALITGWSLWSVSRLPMEVGILGWKFTAVRLMSVLLFPPLAGLIAHAISKRLPAGLD